MHFERFLEWTAAAPAGARADAARALIGAYSHVGRDRQRADRLDRMVGVLLDDPSVAVRRALSEAAARSVDVPRCVVIALAGDDALVASPVLAASPLLLAADLVEAVAAGDADTHLAIAGRAEISNTVAMALAETAQRDAVLALLYNAATLTPKTLRRILQRFGDDSDIREALLEHAHLDPALHHELVLASTAALTHFAVACGWMSQARVEGLRRDSHDKGVVMIAVRCREARGPDGPRALVHHLRAIDRLTPALLLRALLSGNLDLCEAALADLSGVAPARVMGHMRAPSSLGFASLYAKAGLPPALLPVFRATLRVVPAEGARAATLSRTAIGEVLEACQRAATPELARVTSLLRRFEAEALRDDARPVPLGEPEPVRHRGAPDLAAIRARVVPQLTLRAA